MKKVLLTGIGLVGSQIVRILRERHDITPIVMDIDFNWAYLDTIIPRTWYIPIKGSVLDTAVVSEVLRSNEIQYIIHSAAVLPMRVGHDPHPGFSEVNVWGSANLMFQARAANVKKFVLFSTNGVYQFRQYPVTCPVTEEFPSGLSSHNSYGNSKASAESLLRELTQRGDIDGKIVRPGEIYGPVMSQKGEEPIYWKRMFDAAIDNQHFVLHDHPEHRLDWVYCKDVAEIAVRLLLAESTPHIEYHAAYSQCMGIYDIKKQLDISFPGNRIELNGCGKGGWNQPLSMERVKSELEYTPQYNLEKGIEDYAKWHKESKGSNI